MKKLLPLLMAVLLVAVLVVPASASTGDKYYYGELLLPQIEETHPYNFIYVSATSGTTVHVSFYNYTGDGTQGFGASVYTINTLSNGEWVFFGESTSVNYYTCEMMQGAKPVWADFNYEADMPYNPSFVASEPVLKEEQTPDTDTGTTVSHPDYPADWDSKTYPYAFMLHDPNTNEYYFYGYNKEFTANEDGSITLLGPAYGLKYAYNMLYANPWGEPTFLSVAAFDPVTFQSTLDVVWSNYDIRYANGDLFFQGTPTVQSQMSGVVTEATLRGVLDQIVMILPIGLACGISWAALRKGLALLRKILLEA